MGPVSARAKMGSKGLNRVKMGQNGGHNVLNGVKRVQNCGRNGLNGVKMGSQGSKRASRAQLVGSCHQMPREGAPDRIDLRPLGRNGPKLGNKWGLKAPFAAKFGMHFGIIDSVLAILGLF